MKAFDHDRPANRDEWLFAFVEAYRALRPEIGEKYAKTHAVTAHSSLRDIKPAQAAKEWLKRGPKPGRRIARATARSRA